MFHLKITEALISSVRRDLRRRHPFAYERVGFLTAGVSCSPAGDFMLICRNYKPVPDEHYEESTTVGAQIGSDAMREAIEFAHPKRSALLHVHSHGGRGVPEFSKTDVVSACQFVPGFFNPLPRTPHGILVLSDTGATGLVWTSRESHPRYFDRLTQIGASVQRIGGHRGQA